MGIRPLTAKRVYKMLLIMIVFITAATGLSILRVRTQAALRTAPFGWMSEQWLDEHRTANPA